jgi:hypothetical protein
MIGGSAAQSSSLQLIDAAMGIKHEKGKGKSTKDGI